MSRLIFLAAIVFTALTLALACSDDASTTGDGDTPDGDRSETDDDGDRLPDGDLPSDGDELEQPPDWWWELPEVLPYSNGFMRHLTFSGQAGLCSFTEPIEKTFTGIVTSIRVRQWDSISDQAPMLTVDIQTENAEDITISLKGTAFANLPEREWIDMEDGESVLIRIWQNGIPYGHDIGCYKSFYMTIEKNGNAILASKLVLNNETFDAPSNIEPFDIKPGKSIARGQISPCWYWWMDAIDWLDGNSIIESVGIYPDRVIAFKDHTYFMQAAVSSHTRKLYNDDCNRTEDGDMAIDGDRPLSNSPSDWFSFFGVRLKDWPQDDPPCASLCDCEYKESCIGGRCVGRSTYYCCESDRCSPNHPCFDSANNWGVCE